MNITARANPGVDTPDESTSIVEKSMIKDSPNHDFIPVERVRAPSLLPKTNPRSRSKVHTPSVVELLKVGVRASKQTTLSMIREIPLVHPLGTHLPRPAHTVLESEVVDRSIE